MLVVAQAVLATLLALMFRQDQVVAVQTHLEQLEVW
jgi:hypothetical protein